MMEMMEWKSKRLSEGVEKLCEVHRNLSCMPFAMPAKFWV
jgi:hypothetical protein